MARTTAPLFSLDASGTIANSLVFSKWRGRQYVRRHARPSNPKTIAQVGMRAMMKFLATVYASVRTTVDASYDVPAAAANVTPFNAFVAYNMRRWREFKGPSIEYPAAEDATAVTITQGLTGGQRNVILVLTPSADDLNFGIAIFRSASTIVTPNWNNCIAVVSADGANAVQYTDAPLSAGTYHYRSGVINSTGDIGTICADGNATVT